MQKKIGNLLEMTNASIQLMKDMTGLYCVCVRACVHTEYTAIHNNVGCVNEIVQNTSREKTRVLKDLEQ